MCGSAVLKGVIAPPAVWDELQCAVQLGRWGQVCWARCVEGKSRDSHRPVLCWCGQNFGLRLCIHTHKTKQKAVISYQQGYMIRLWVAMAILDSILIWPKPLTQRDQPIYPITELLTGRPVKAPGELLGLGWIEVIREPFSSSTVTDVLWLRCF